MLTPKEIFNKVKTHLLTQGERAAEQVGPNKEDVASCSYRIGELKCAIGCLIPDELYTPKIEGWNVSNIDLPSRQSTLLKGVLVKSGLNVADHEIRNMLEHLQEIHDSLDPSEWKMALAKYELDHAELLS